MYLTTTYKIFLVFALVINVIYAQKKIFCYYGSWAVYRPSGGRFTASDINTQICTHVVYAFAGLYNDGFIKVLDPWNDIDLGGYNKFTSLKSRNVNLQTLISVGGYNAGSVIFSSVAANPVYRKNFITSAINFMRTYNFDGIEIAWLYPGLRGGQDLDKNNFIILLQEFRAAIGQKLLTVAVSAVPPPYPVNYNVVLLSNTVDYINVMAYNFNEPSELRIGFNAPLYSTKIPSVSSSIINWLLRGAAASKILMGIPAYGRTFTLLDQTQVNTIGAPSRDGIAGVYSKQPGILTYNEICILQKTESWNYKWYDACKVPYIYKGNQWISFDNEISVYLKAKYIKEKNLAGAALWSIDMDPVGGLCQKTNPILNNIKDGLA